jgi:hypothetical protein
MLLEEEGRMPNDEPMNHDGVDIGLQMWPNKFLQDSPIVQGVIVFSLQNVAKVDHVNTYHIQVIKLCIQHCWVDITFLMGPFKS